MWSLVREAGAWRLYRGSGEAPAARITVDPDSAWRLLYNAFPADVAPRAVRVEGDARLAEPLFPVRPVMV